MLMGHLLGAVALGVLAAGASLLLDFSLLMAAVHYVLFVNIGLGLSALAARARRVGSPRFAPTELSSQPS